MTSIPSIVDENDIRKRAVLPLLIDRHSDEFGGIALTLPAEAIMRVLNHPPPALQRQTAHEKLKSSKLTEHCLNSPSSLDKSMKTHNFFQYFIIASSLSDLQHFIVSLFEIKERFKPLIQRHQNSRRKSKTTTVAKTLVTFNLICVWIDLEIRHFNGLFDQEVRA